MLYENLTLENLTLENLTLNLYIFYFQFYFIFSFISMVRTLITRKKTKEKLEADKQRQTVSQLSPSNKRSSEDVVSPKSNKRIKQEVDGIFYILYLYLYLQS